jgi:hypothetical protein
MLLGLVLALAAAAIVFYITSTVQGTLSQTVSVVTAQTNIKAGTILTLNNAVAPSMRIQDAFAVKQIDKKLAPADAFIFTNQDALNTTLNNQVVKEEFLAGDVLRNNDPRLAPVGQTSGTSLTNINPPALKPGQVLVPLKVDNADFGVQPGDSVDIIVASQTYASGKPGSFVFNTQGPITVYAVDVPAKGKVVIVLDELQVVRLVQYQNNGDQFTIVIRKPGDETPAPTTIETGG